MKDRTTTVIGAILLAWALITLLLAVSGCSGPMATPLQAQAPTTQTTTSWQWQFVPKQPDRIMIWGGSSGYPHDTWPNRATQLDPQELTDYWDFPKQTICWDTFQVGSKGRGPVASYLIVQPMIGTGIAIRDDAPFQRPRLCTQGIPTVTLINNWSEHQVMTFMLEGEVIVIQ